MAESNNVTDNRKKNGGSRIGSGQKKLPDGEKKVTVSFQIKEKHVQIAREAIQKIVDEINNKID